MAQVYPGRDTITQTRRNIFLSFRIRTTPDQPLHVLSVTIFAYLKYFVLAQPLEKLMISIATIRYVQTNPSCKATMSKGIPSATWDPVTGGLCSKDEFLVNMDRSDD